MFHSSALLLSDSDLRPYTNLLNRQRERFRGAVEDIFVARTAEDADQSLSYKLEFISVEEGPCCENLTAIQDHAVFSTCLTGFAADFQTSHSSSSEFTRDWLLRYLELRHLATMRGPR